MLDNEQVAQSENKKDRKKRITGKKKEHVAYMRERNLMHCLGL